MILVGLRQYLQQKQQTIIVVLASGHFFTLDLVCHFASPMQPG
jgi:hypothetical protein